MKEIWKEVLKGYYEVSNLGRVRRARPGWGTYVGRLLKLTPRKDGYISVSLPGRKTYGVHQLVAEAFIGPCPRGKEVNHKDTNKQNNDPSNLEYLTRSKNMKHAYRLGLCAPITRAKLTEEKVAKLRKLYKEGNFSQKELSKMFGLKSVWHIVSGRQWRHV